MFLWTNLEFKIVVRYKIYIFENNRIVFRKKSFFWFEFYEKADIVFDLKHEI